MAESHNRFKLMRHDVLISPGEVRYKVVVVGESARDNIRFLRLQPIGMTYADQRAISRIVFRRIVVRLRSWQLPWPPGSMVPVFGMFEVPSLQFFAIQASMNFQTPAGSESPRNFSVPAEAVLFCRKEMIVDYNGFRR